MANTTFNGPVRSENGFDDIIKNSSTGGITSDMKLSTYSTSITIAATGTAHKEASMGVAVTVTRASANNVNLVDIGTDADPDGFVDGLPTMPINATGFKGFFGCNGILGMSGFAAGSVATETADEVEVTISGTAGAGGVIALKFFGLSSNSATE